jgi:hypothetical protein
VRRDTLLAMARRDRRDWIGALRSQYGALGLWERRALLVASFILGEAGRHWRKQRSGELGPLDELVQRWAGERKGAGNGEIPL